MPVEKTDLRDKQTSVRFLFVGRLVAEKGFDRVISVAKYILAHDVSRATLSIYGDGALRKKMILELSKFPWFLDASNGALPQWGEKVVYFGHRPSRIIGQALMGSHYMLMPSRFLESFGLSALEAISYGVPVVGYKKGGLTQFLLSEHALADSGDDGRDTALFLECVSVMIGRFSGSDWRRQSHTARDIAAKYSSDHWLDTIAHQIWTGKRILLVSDYLAPIGGIETHLATITSLLEKRGYEVSVFGAVEHMPSRFGRIFGCLTSLWNPLVRSRLEHAIRDFKPEVIWCHSVVRALGPLALESVVASDTYKVMTYHDLGYFGGYATRFEHESELALPQTFSVFYKSAPFIDKIFPLYLWFKYTKLQKISAQLRAFDLHIVPSDFMEQAVRVFLQKSDANIQTIPHAIALWTR